MYKWKIIKKSNIMDADLALKQSLDILFLKKSYIETTKNTGQYWDEWDEWSYKVLEVGAW